MRGEGGRCYPPSAWTKGEEKESWEQEGKHDSDEVDVCVHGFTVKSTHRGVQWNASGDRVA